MMSDASFVTYRYFTIDNGELDGLNDSDDDWKTFFTTMMSVGSFVSYFLIT